MHMRSFSPAVCTALLALLPVCGVVAQAQAPAAADKQKSATGDIYLQGHLIMLDGDKLRKENKYAAAYYKYKEARDIFDSVHASDPGWNAEIVDFRRKKIREELETVRQLEIARRQAGGAPESGSTPDSPETDGSAPLDVKSALPADDPAAPARSSGMILNERIRALKLQIEKLEKRNDETLKSLGQKENELFHTKKDLLEAQSNENKMRERLADASARLDTAAASEKRKNSELLKEVESLRTRLKDAEEKLTAANERSTKMADELSGAWAQIKELTSQRDELKRERDQMAALMSGEGMKSMDRLKIVEENQRLRAKLEETSQKVAQMTAEKDADKQEIATLKEEVKTSKESLAALQQENEEYRQQLASVTAKLDATQTRLAEAAAGGLPEGEASTENGILREIVLQQLKQQYRREQARKNLMEDLSKEGVLEGISKLGVQSEEILRTLNEMAAPVTLTREQRNAITSTQINKLMTSGDGRELFVVDDTSSPAAVPDQLPESSGAADKAALSTELKAYANAAEEQFRSGDYENAESNFKKILVVEPQNVYALCNLGVIQLRQSRNDEASVTLKKALAYDYNSERGHYLLGVAQLRQGNHEEAATEIREGLKLNPRNSAAHYVLGFLSNMNGDRSAAIREFEQSINIDSGNSAAYHALAVLYFKSGRMEDSRRSYNLAVKNGAPRDKDLDMLFNQ